MADLETAELLDIDVDHLAGRGALIATHRPGRLQRRAKIVVNSSKLII
jgi:hypothetical protein